MGALLCGSKNFIERSRSNLRRIGGSSIHQSGIFAAAGLVALKTIIPQLAEDNRRAQQLGHGFAGLNTTRISPYPVDTNIVMANIDRSFMSGRTLLKKMTEFNILATLCSDDVVRFVTHRHITNENIEQVVYVLRKIISSH
jgi:threonine aldolase